MKLCVSERRKFEAYLIRNEYQPSGNCYTGNTAFSFMTNTILKINQFCTWEFSPDDFPLTSR